MVSPSSNPGLIYNFEGLFGLVLEIPFIESKKKLSIIDLDFGLSITNGPCSWLRAKFFHPLACGMLRRTVLMFSVKNECSMEIVYEMSSDRDNVDTDRQSSSRRFEWSWSRQIWSTYGRDRKKLQNRGSEIRSIRDPFGP